MVGTDGPDNDRPDEAQEVPESPDSGEVEGTAEAAPVDPEPEGDGAMIRSPSQEMAAIPDEEPEPEPVPEPETDWEAQYDKARNQLLRVAADFENFKKRTRRDLQDVSFRARDDVLQELLPVIDNLERAIEHADQSQECVDADTLLEGVRMVLRQFEGSMERFGVKGISALGEPFDPNFHEALQQRETEEVPPGHVVEEYRKGYMMGERLVRPAMVVVAVAPAENGKDSADSGDDETLPDEADGTTEASGSGDPDGDGGTGEERSGD